MAIDRITVRGARQHNLKNIDVDIPRDKLTVITGLFSDQSEALGDGGGDHSRASGSYLTGVHVKKSDSVVVNDISRRDIGFDVEDNEVTIITKGGEHVVPRTSKASVAAAVLDAVDELRAGRDVADGAVGASAGSTARV